MSMTSRSSEISSDILTSVKMIDYNSKTNNKNRCCKSPQNDMKKTSIFKANYSGNKLTAEDSNNNIFKDIINRKLTDNIKTDKLKEQSFSWMSKQSPKLGGEKTIFHPAVVSSSFGPCTTSSAMSCSTYIPKMSYCNLNRCYQKKFKQKYFTNLSCASGGNIGSPNRNNTSVKHINNHCDKNMQIFTPKSSQQQLTQTYEIPAKEDYIDNQGEEKNNFFVNQDHSVVNDWMDLCTDDESDEAISYVVPDSWEEDVDPEENGQVQCKAEIKSNATEVKDSQNNSPEGSKKELKNHEFKTENIPHIKIKINSYTPSGIIPNGEDINDDKSCILFMRKDNKKCRPSSKKRRRSKAKKPEEEEDESNAESAQKSCANQNSAVAFMLGYNKSCDKTEENLQPTHSFYVTFDDSEHSSDWSDDDTWSDNEHDEFDCNRWLESEFDNPLNLSVICSVKQHDNAANSKKELEEINLAWEVQIRRRPSSCSLNSQEKKSKSAKKVHFPENEKIAEVHPMIAWSHAYQEARKGPWHQYALDSERFRRRIDELEKILSPVLTFEHRNKMYTMLQQKKTVE